MNTSLQQIFHRLSSAGSTPMMYKQNSLILLADGQRLFFVIICFIIVNLMLVSTQDDWNNLDRLNASSRDKQQIILLC